MKVCNITMSYCPIRGGQETYIENLISTFKNGEIESSVMQPDNGCIKDNVFLTPKIPVINFIGNAKWFMFNLGLIFRKKILAEQDILICHYPFHYPSIKWHKKVIIVSHGVLWSENKRNIFDWYHKRISLKAKASGIPLVANDTNYLREVGYDIEPACGFFEQVYKNVWFIPNCVDTNYFTRKERIKKEKIILVPRNIREDRGIHLAIEAFSYFVKEHPDFKMEIIGKGTNSEYFRRCQRLVSGNGLEGKIIFRGHIEWSEMVDQYNKSMLTLIPTLEKEGTSLSALESMSCGTATVVTDVCGLKDLPAVKASTSPKGISDALISTLSNIDEISTKQQQDVRSNFNLNLWEEAWLKVINSIKNDE